MPPRWTRRTFHAAVQRRVVRLHGDAHPVLVRVEVPAVLLVPQPHAPLVDEELHLAGAGAAAEGAGADGGEGIGWVSACWEGRLESRAEEVFVARRLRLVWAPRRGGSVSRKPMPGWTCQLAAGCQPALHPLPCGPTAPGPSRHRDHARVAGSLCQCHGVQALQATVTLNRTGGAQAN